MKEKEILRKTIPHLTDGESKDLELIIKCDTIGVKLITGLWKGFSPLQRAEIKYG